MEEMFLRLLEKLLEETPDKIVVFGAIYYIIVRPLNRKLSAISGYIKRFLALQRQRARGQEALAAAVSDLAAKIVPDGR